MTDPRSFTMVQALIAGDDPPLVLGDVVERPGWMRDALCREYPDVDFFPTRGESVEPAKAICRRCLVVDECAAYAEALPSDIGGHGIWAGMPPAGRKAARAGRPKRGARRRAA